MGLYDTFLAPPGLLCPSCGSALADFQTKGLCEGMGRFKIGDSVHLDGDDLFISDGWVNCLGDCSTCRCWLEAKAHIHEGRYTRLEVRLKSDR